MKHSRKQTLSADVEPLSPDVCVCVQVLLSGPQSVSVRVCELGAQSASVLLHLPGLHRARPLLLCAQMSVLPRQLVPQGLRAGTEAGPASPVLTFILQNVSGV